VGLNCDPDHFTPVALHHGESWIPHSETVGVVTQNTQ
jgi:hypothetical protein